MRHINKNVGNLLSSAAVLFDMLLGFPIGLGGSKTRDKNFAEAGFPVTASLFMMFGVSLGKGALKMKNEESP